MPALLAAGWAVVDYRRYAARTNASAVWAWAATRYLTATTKDLHAAAVDSTSLDRTGRRFLGDLPARAGVRPSMVRGIPHRQLDQHPDTEARSAFRQRLSTVEDLHDLAGDRLEFRRSLWELTGAEALVSRDLTPATCGPELIRTKGEFAHLHSHDGSLHLVMSPPDIATVIDSGWGELFAVSGGLGGRIPPIVLVYAPRTEAEADVVATILRGAYRYATTAEDNA